MKKHILFCLGILIAPILHAQIPEPREEDQFWKKRVVIRVDLEEATNLAFKRHSKETYPDLKFEHKEGIATALLNGLRNEEFSCYDAHTWKKLDYGQVARRMQYLEALQNRGEHELTALETTNQWLDIQTESEAASSASLTELPEIGTFTSDIFRLMEEKSRFEANLEPYEYALNIVEDWIFDKNASKMLYIPRYIQLIWVDPTGTLPERILANFDYMETQKLLEKTQWKSRQNEAANLSLREAIELHLYHGILSNLSGRPITTLDEAQKRYQELIEFESYLWSN